MVGASRGAAAAAAATARRGVGEAAIDTLPAHRATGERSCHGPAAVLLGVRKASLLARPCCAWSRLRRRMIMHVMRAAVIGRTNERLWCIGP